MKLLQWILCVFRIFLIPMYRIFIIILDNESKVPIRTVNCFRPFVSNIQSCKQFVNFLNSAFRFFNIFTIYDLKK